MANIVSRIFEYESSLPIPNLIVTWYLTRRLNLPQKFQDFKNWETLRKDNWKELNVIRLGSGYTDENGTARLTYDTNRYQREEKNEFNIWYTIQSPEIAGLTNCSQIIHVACYITINASESEEFLIHIPRSILTQFGIEEKVSPIIDGKRTTNEFNIQLSKVEKGPFKLLAADQNPFSKRFNQDFKEAKTAREKQFGAKPKPMSFSLALNLARMDKSEDQPPKISYDNRKKKLVVNGTNNSEDKNISFDGILRYTHPGLSKKKIKKPHIIVNKNTGKLQIALPKVPESLELSETNPSKLFQYNDDNLDKGNL